MPLKAHIETLLDQVEALHRHHPTLESYQSGLGLAVTGLAEALDALPLEEAEELDDAGEAASASSTEPPA